MGRLVYTMNVSLDGFVETPDHSLDWTTVDEEVHRWFGERNREADALLYGRRLYEVMAAYWPTAGSDPTATAFVLDYARTWNARPKIVFSSTLSEVGPGSRLIRTDAVAELDRLRAEFPGDLLVGGPTLASAFIERNLVDRYDLVVHPVVLGGGTPFFPKVAAPLRLRLVDTHRFGSGVMHLGYEPLRD
ncbi:MAG TPA: dihydrofolate reductase family protein [Candidatus Limnocylindrales bacterium]|nr:dihydrofolate reductase family protein [Candidatus Limnocylindrales bacterium]